MSMQIRQHLNFYETDTNDRLKPAITHNDLCADETFSDLTSELYNELTQFIISSEWDMKIERVDGRVASVSIPVANELFRACYDKFKDRISLVDLFDVITSETGIPPATYYQSLLQAYRILLLLALNESSAISTKLYHTSREPLKLDATHTVNRLI